MGKNNKNVYDSYYRDNSTSNEELDLIFNKIVEVNNSGNQQVYNLISDVEGKLSSQLNDIRNFLSINPITPTNNHSNGSYWPINSIQQPIASYRQFDDPMSSSIFINQFENLKKEIINNNRIVSEMAQSNPNFNMETIIDTSNKNAEQLHNALNYLENNISTGLNDQNNLNYDFQESLNFLREEVYASQNSLIEAINMNSNNSNNDVQSLYEEITKVNDDNTKNLFEYISLIENNINNKIDISTSMNSDIFNKVNENIQVNDENTSNLFNYIADVENNLNYNIQENTIIQSEEIHNRINDIENRIFDNNEITKDINSEIFNKVSENVQVNDENTSNLFNYIADVENNLNHSMQETSLNQSQNIHNRIDDIENRIFDNNEIAKDINYGIIEKVDESSIIYQDLLMNLRDELLNTNYDNFNEIMNVASQLREELLENDNITSTTLIDQSNIFREESSSQLNYLNQQIEHIKTMLYNLNDVIGINNVKFESELNKTNNLLKNNVNNDLQNIIKENQDNIKYHNDLERTKELNKNKKESEVEELPWDDWDNEEEEEKYMDNYKNNNSRRRSNRIDESKLDIIYDRVEEINIEINNKLYELEMNIVGLVNDRDNQLHYQQVEFEKRNEKKLLDVIEEITSNNEEKNKSLRKELLEKIINLKEDFSDKNKKIINELEGKLQVSISETNTTTSNIIDEMINSQGKFDDLFKELDSRLYSFEGELSNLSNNQYSTYGETKSTFEDLYISLDKNKSDIKKTHLIWDENNDKIQALQDKINVISKDIQRISTSGDYQEVMVSLSKIDDLIKNHENLKTNLVDIQSSNSEIEKKLNAQKESIDEKINTLYQDFHSVIDSFEEKIQQDIVYLSDESKSHVQKSNDELSDKILDETNKKMVVLENQMDESSIKLETRIVEVNDEINDILGKLDNKIKKETEEKINMLYQETVDLVSNIQMENDISREKIESINNILMDKLENSNEKILNLEELVSKTKFDIIKDTRVDDIIQKIDEMKSSNKDTALEIQTIHDSWTSNNEKINILEEILKNQSIEMENFSNLSQDALTDSFDQINILYENESKIKEEIQQIQSTNLVLENKLSQEKEILENKIEKVSTNIDSMLLDFDNKFSEKNDNKMIELYEETLYMIDSLKEENKNSFEEISSVNEGVNLNLFEVNSKIAELEHITNLEPENNIKFQGLFNTINEIKDANIKSESEVKLLINSWKLNNEKIINLENLLEKRSEEILLLTKNTDENFNGAFLQMEELYKSENSIKNEILSINEVNNSLEKKLLEEKKSLDERIETLNVELENKILETETNILEKTEDKFKILNENIDSKLVSLHNEVMSLIGELNEGNQEIHNQISVIENDTIKAFDLVDQKVVELYKLNSGISDDDPKYIEINNLISQMTKTNEEQSIFIEKLQNDLNKNIERSNSLKKILVAQSKEIEFIAASSESAISTSFDRIHELFVSEKNIKEEIEKIYLENNSIKEEINKEKLNLSEKINNLSLEVETKLSSTEEKINNKILDVHFELIENIKELHSKNIYNLEKITYVETSLKNEIEENKSKINDLNILVNKAPENDPKFNKILIDIKSLKEYSKISLDKMQENHDFIYINNKKILSLKKMLDNQGKEINILTNNTEENFIGVHDHIQNLFTSEKNIKEEIEKIYLENIDIQELIYSESKNNKEKIDNKTLELSNIFNKEINNLSLEVETKLLSTEEKINNKILDVHFELIENIKELHSKNIYNLEKITYVETSLKNEIEENKSKINDLNILVNKAPENDPKFNKILIDIKSLKEYSKISLDKMQENHDFIYINNKKILSLKKMLDNQGKEINILTNNTEENFIGVHDHIQNLFTSEKNIKEEIEKIYLENIDIQELIYSESKNNKEKIDNKTLELSNIFNKEINNLSLEVETKLLSTEEKINNKILDVHFELIENIKELHSKNIYNLEKVTYVETSLKNEIEENKSKINDLNILVNKAPENDPKFNKILIDIKSLKEYSEISLDKMQESYDLLYGNNKKMFSLKKILDNQGKEINTLTNNTEDNFIGVYDQIQNIFTSEKNIKEEIEKIYLENIDIQELIYSESKNNKEEIKNKTLELSSIFNKEYKNVENKINLNYDELKNLLVDTELNTLNKVEEANIDLRKIIDDTENSILGVVQKEQDDIRKIVVQTNEKIEEVSIDMSERLELLYQDMISMITEISDGNQILAEEITNLDKYTRVTLMSIDSKISEIDFLVNQIPEENPKFQNFIRDIDVLKEFSINSSDEINKIHKSWLVNNNKLSSLEDILLKQSEELSLLSASNEEVWNLSFDRIQELYESESNIKEEIEKISFNNEQIKFQFNIEKDKLEAKIIDINTNLIYEIHKSKEEVIVNIDDKIMELSSSMENKIGDLYDEITNIISEVHSYNEINSNQILSLSDQINNFITETNNKLFEITETIELLPEEDPKFKYFIHEIEQLKADNDVSIVEIKNIHNAWLVNNNKLSSLENILLKQSEELSLLSASNEEVWNLSFDRIQELYESESNIKEEINKIYDLGNNIKYQFEQEKEKLENRLDLINNNLSNEILNSKEELLTQMDEKVQQISFDVENKIGNLYDEITNIISEVHSYNEINSNQIFSLKDEINNFVIDTNNKLFEVTEEMNLLPEENPKFKDLINEVEQLRTDNDISMYEIKKIHDSWILNNNKLFSIEDILLKQSEELSLLSASNEEVWNLSFDRIQELYESEINMKKEIVSIYKETDSIKDKFNIEKNKVETRLEIIDTDVKEKLNFLKIDLDNKIDIEINNISNSLSEDFNEKIDLLFHQTIELVENVKLTCEESNSKLSQFSESLSYDLESYNRNILFLEEEINKNIDFIKYDFNDRVSDIKELNVSTNLEIEKNKKMWLLNNFRLNSLQELLISQSKEIDHLNGEYELTEASKVKIDNLLEIDNSLQIEIDEIIKSNEKLERNLNNQKENLMSKINDLVSDVKEEINFDFNDKLEGVYNQSMEMISIVSDTIHENKNSLDIVHNLINNNYELANQKIQKLVQDVNSKFDKKDGLEKMNEFAKMNNDISQEITRVQKAWVVNNEKLNSLENIFNEEMKKHEDNFADLDYKSESMQDNLTDILELDGSLKNEIESLKNKNIILEDNLFNFKKDFEDNIKSIISEIDVKIDTIGNRVNLEIDKVLESKNISSKDEIMKSVESVIYSIVIKEIDNLPYKQECLRLKEEDEIIKINVQRLFKKLNDKNMTINQMIFDEIWNCNIKIESLIGEVSNLSRDSIDSIVDIKKYNETISLEIQKSYMAWITNNKKIMDLEELIINQNKLIMDVSHNVLLNDSNHEILLLKEKIDSINIDNDILSKEMNDIIKKQELSIEHLHNEILNIINNRDEHVHKTIEESLKSTNYKMDIDDSMEKDEIKKIISDYSEKVVSNELRNFIEIFKDYDIELNKSHNAWLKNNQRISLLEDIVIEHEKSFKKIKDKDFKESKYQLSKNEKESIEKLILNHKKRLL